MTTVRKGNEKNTTTIKVKSEGVGVMVYSTTFNKNGTIKVKKRYNRYYLLKNSDNF
jgi:hypothetical protein